MCKGKIYIGATGHETATKLLELAEVTETAADDLVLIKGEPIEITVEAKIDKLTMLSILTGTKITNNWLKLHGGIMRRKRFVNG